MCDDAVETNVVRGAVTRDRAPDDAEAIADRSQLGRGSDDLIGSPLPLLAGRPFGKLLRNLHAGLGSARLAARCVMD